MLFNLVYVEETHKPIYSIITWNDWESWLYIALALVLSFIGFLIGWTFSCLMKNSYEKEKSRQNDIKVHSKEDCEADRLLANENE